MIGKATRFVLIVLAGCESNTLTFVTPDMSSCAGDFGDASDNCPPSACPIVGTWQNEGLVGAPPCAEGAVLFAAAGEMLRLTSSGWAPAGRYSTCANRARGAMFDALFDVHRFPDCEPACEVSFVAMPLDGG